MQVLKEVTDNDLDPRMTNETRQFVTKFLTTTDPRAITKLPLDVVRENRNNTSKLLNNSLNIPDLVQKEFYVQNINDGYDIPVTAYIPNGLTQNSPLVVFFHGGGWTFCSRTTHHFAVASLAEASKCIWLSVEYRLAPEHKHPVGLEDCLSVAKWSIQNKCNEFNLHENVKIGVSGDSAGGTYAASISHELRDTLSFQLLVYPCVHMSLHTPSKDEFSRDCFVLIPEVINFFGKNILNSDNDLFDPRLSPLLRDNFKNLPPALIIAAELDPLVDQSKIYHDKLLEHNNESEHYVVKGVHHGYFNVPPLMPNAFKETVGYFVQFLNKFKC